jgi:hypothetical protein
MGMFGKIGAGLSKIGKYYTSPEGAQTALAILSDYGGNGENYQSLQRQRQALAREAQARAQEQADQEQINAIINGGGGAGLTDLGTAGNGGAMAGAGPSGGLFGRLRDPNTIAMLAMMAGRGNKSVGTILDIARLTQPDHQAVNMGNGGVGTYDGSTGQFSVLREPDARVEGFTLGNGQTRFSADGRPIASVAQKYAPPRSGGGRGGSSAMDAIAAELRRRGHQVD